MVNRAEATKPSPCFAKGNLRFDGTGVGWIMRDEPKRLDFDRMNDALEQIPKLPEVATKAPPVGRAAPFQSKDWLGA